MLGGGHSDLLDRANFLQVATDQRDVALDLFRDLRRELSETIFPRCQHVSEVRQPTVQNRTSVGLTLKGATILGLVVGGPSFFCGQLSVGDNIVQVDGNTVTSDNLHELLVGNDIPGSFVTITVKRTVSSVSSAEMDTPTYNTISVVLERVPSEEIADQRYLQEILESIQVELICRFRALQTLYPDKSIGVWKKDAGTFSSNIRNAKQFIRMYQTLVKNASCARLASPRNKRNLEEVAVELSDALGQDSYLLSAN